MGDVADRLSSLDVSFLYVEDLTTPMHVGAVSLFQAPEAGFDYDRLVRLIRDRIAFVPRYRQRVRRVPGNMAGPVWVDDENFDVTYHVRRSALPRPGTEGQLRELVARIMSRPLDRNRPLWEMYLVEGLEGGRFALLTKTHQSVVDGISAIDIGQVILDVTPEPRQTAADAWRPSREPSQVELVAGAVGDMLRSPAVAADTARRSLADVRTTSLRLGQQAVGLVSAAWSAARPGVDSPLNAEIGQARRFAMAEARLDDLKAVRARHGGTVNDVVLAVVTGALRDWLLARGESAGPRSTVRALVPVSVRDEADPEGGTRVAAFLLDLPVGEPDPIVRLQRISFEMGQYRESGRMIGADALVALAGFAPPTLHALGARVGSGLSRRVYNLVVTNVPGPQFPLYAGGARMLATYPVVPLTKGQGVSVGCTSYDGGVYFGLNGDRDAMPDLDLLAECLERSLDDYAETARPARRRRVRAAGQATGRAPEPG
jgi:WS/DGAT/MGAT family acyltransferase